MSADSGRQIIDRLLGTVALQQSEIESLRAEVDELREALFETARKFTLAEEENQLLKVEVWGLRNAVVEARHYIHLDEYDEAISVLDAAQ